MVSHNQGRVIHSYTNKSFEGFWSKTLKPCSAQGYIPIMQGQIRDSAPSWETLKGQRILHAIYNLPAQQKKPQTLAGKSTWNNKTKYIFSFDQIQNIKIKEENRQESK